MCSIATTVLLEYENSQSDNVLFRIFVFAYVYEKNRMVGMETLQ